ncbi:covalently-linked cell wall protein [Colletotrichum tofieldiae]|nr:covalently-linked cell wall protein [Colletotrichum tofieldiae]
MRFSALATATLAGLALAMPQASSRWPSPSCQTSFDGNFGLTIVELGKQSLNAGVIYTSGFSVCTNGSLALGGSTTFYRCLSGNFWNLYDRDWAEQCSPIHLSVLPCAEDAPVPSGGQVVGTTMVATTLVTVLEDGQPQVIATTVPLPICQIGDGQIQGHTTLCGELPPATLTATQPAYTPLGPLPPCHYRPACPDDSSGFDSSGFDSPVQLHSARQPARHRADEPCADEPRGNDHSGGSSRIGRPEPRSGLILGARRYALRGSVHLRAMPPALERT